MRKLTVAVLLAVACTQPFDPNRLQIDGRWSLDSQRFEANWIAMEACSHLHGDFHAVKFYMADSIKLDGEEYGGFWIESENAIVFEPYITPILVNHEIMHALLQSGDHPTTYFNRLCGDLMDVYQ